jgi:hypothetical protein
MNKQILFFLSITFLFGIMPESSSTQPADPLMFPKDSFTIETKTVKTSSGEKIVTYHSYMHIPYVAKPVDSDYQSLNVSVPVKIDEVPVDASNAPILFNIVVGGYMSVKNVNSGSSVARGVVQGGPGGNSIISGKADLALAAGYIVVTPGCRGRDNKASDGTYYGKAPSAIVDLKAAIRYLRHNKGIMPGNTDQIVSTGVSAGGALSALLGASGNSRLYDTYLKEIGAADAKDNIFASACFCPITDLEHADGAYEWMYGSFPARSGLVDQELSAQLKTIFAEYQVTLKLQGKNGFGMLTADNYDKYLLKYYLIPSANKFLNRLTEDKLSEYLAKNPWINWSSTGSSFTFSDYVAHAGRMKGLPAFDDFAMKQPEPVLFGNKTTDARHFTNFSLQQSSGNKSAEIGPDVNTIVNLMNAMYFIGQNNSDCTNNWWLRQGTSDPHTSQTVIVNLATSLENRKMNVNTFLYWDAGHGADLDAEEFIEWVGQLTGFSFISDKKK